MVQYAVLIDIFGVSGNLCFMYQDIVSFVSAGRNIQTVDKGNDRFDVFPEIHHLSLFPVQDKAEVQITVVMPYRSAACKTPHYRHWISFQKTPVYFPENILVFAYDDRRSVDIKQNEIIPLIMQQIFFCSQVKKWVIRGAVDTIKHRDRFYLFSLFTGLKYGLRSSHLLSVFLNRR